MVEDAAHAVGAKYKGLTIGSISDFTMFSFQAIKHITTGDGGILTSNDEMTAKKCRKFGSMGYALMTASEGRLRLNKEVFQDPNYKRHDGFAYNYRMPEVAAALGLAQTERFEFFIGLREKIGLRMYDIASSSDTLIPQKKIPGARNTYWTFAARMVNEDVKWQDFRKKYIEFGGESVFAAWALTYHEPVVSEGIFKKQNPSLYSNIEYFKEDCPVAEEIQPQLMQFPLNYSSYEEAEAQFDALEKTLRYYK